MFIVLVVWNDGLPGDIFIKKTFTICGKLTTSSILRKMLYHIVLINIGSNSSLYGMLWRIYFSSFNIKYIFLNSSKIFQMCYFKHTYKIRSHQFIIVTENPVCFLLPNSVQRNISKVSTYFILILICNVVFIITHTFDICK